MSEERRKRFASEKHEYHDPRVMIDFWFDERARREADYRESVDLYSRGEHPMQRLAHYTSSLNREFQCTESHNGLLLNGSRVGIASRCSNIYLSALPNLVWPDGKYKMPCLATGTYSCKNVPARSAIRITRFNKEIPDNIHLMIGECLTLCHVGSAERLYLTFDSANPMPHNCPYWTKEYDSHALWKARGDPRISRFIVVNAPVTLEHVSSGRRLTLDDNEIETVLGMQRKVTCTFDKDEPDKWRFVAPCQNPFSSRRDISAPRSKCEEMMDDFMFLQEMRRWPSRK